jgi:glucose/arabinose dehydrogenase
MRRLLPLLLVAAAFAGCGGGDDDGGGGPDTTAAQTTAPPATTEAPPAGGREDEDVELPKGTVATGLDIPWEMAFLPDGSALVTERGGTVRRLDPRLRLEKQPVARIKVDDAGEGGLLGMAIDPDFDSNPFVYIYRTTGDGNEVLRYTYDGGLKQPRKVVDDIESGFIHDGGRLRFGPDDALYVTTGETGDEDLAQDPRSLNGKILRIENPDRGSARPEIVSSGHRNVQGIDWQPRSNQLFATEFGPDANDELNKIREGRDYGWPDAQGDEGPTPAFIDYEDVIAPSGATFVKRSGSTWTGDLLIATLRGEHLRRVTIDRDGDQVTRDDALYSGRFGRLRQVVEGPDGGIYLLTNNRDGRGTPRGGDDRIIRIVPPRG